MTTQVAPFYWGVSAMRTLLPLIQKAHVASSSPSLLGMSRLVQRLENLPKAHSHAQEQSAGLAAPGGQGCNLCRAWGREDAGGQAGSEEALVCSWRSHPCLGQPEPLSSLCSASMCHSAQGSGGQWIPLCKEAMPSWAAQRPQVGPGPQAGWQLQPGLR